MAKPAAKTARRTSRKNGVVARKGLQVVESSTGQLKRLLTVEGDIRSDIAFQNDVNALLATVSRMSLLDQPGRRNEGEGINLMVPDVDEWQSPRRRRAS